MTQLDLSHLLKGKSQEDKVMWFLEKHGRITNMQCHEVFGIRHAPSIIRNLRKKLAVKDEYEIVNERKEGCNRFGEKTWWDDYVLKKKGETCEKKI